jgi:hypothetical protein
VLLAGALPWGAEQVEHADGLANTEVSGKAVLVSDIAARASFRTWLGAARGVEPPDDWDLFMIDVDALAVVFVDDGQLPVDPVVDERRAQDRPPCVTRDDATEGGSPEPIVARSPAGAVSAGRGAVVPRLRW